jgi:hypothetical protein
MVGIAAHAHNLVTVDVDEDAADGGADTAEAPDGVNEARIRFSLSGSKVRARLERGLAMAEDRTLDLVAIEQLCARYMLLTSQFVDGRWLEVFTPDGVYNAFGTDYTLERFPALLAAAPRGQFIGNMPVVDLAGDRATGKQHFVFFDQQTHEMRLGWYNDEYVRTADGWRIRNRKTTFMRKHGGFDSGEPHDPLSEVQS